MKNRELELANYPTPEELYALEHAARVERAHEVARLLRVAARSVKDFLSRGQAKGLRHA